MLRKNIFIAIMSAIITLACACSAQARLAPHSDSRAAAVAAYNQGVQYFQTRQFAAAANSFKSALAYDPSMTILHATLGQALFLSEQFAEATGELEQGIRFNPNSATLWCQLGVAASHTQNNALAAEAFGRYLQLAPNGSFAEEARRALTIINNATTPSVSPNATYLSEFAGTPHKWASRKTLRVFIEQPNAIVGYTEGCALVFKQALARWGAISNGKLQFVCVDNAPSADIICKYTDNQSTLQSRDELGETMLAYNVDGSIKRATITLLVAPDSVGTDGLRRHAATAMHELGHALGLQHSHDAADVMYPMVAPAGLEFAASLKDKNTLLALYQ